MRSGTDDDDLVRNTSRPDGLSVTGHGTKLTRGSELRVTIEKFADRGKSLARVEGMVIFVSGAVPGDEVDIEPARGLEGGGRGSASTSGSDGSRGGLQKRMC